MQDSWLYWNRCHEMPKIPWSWMLLDQRIPVADFLTKAKVGSWISGQEVWQTPFGNMLLFVCQLIKNRIPLKHLISKKIRFFPAKIPT